MDDFEPENVAKQVKPLKELLDLRTKLSDLRGSLQGNDKLEELLHGRGQNTEKLEKLKAELGKAGGETMSDAQEAATAAAAARSRQRSRRLLDQIVEQGRFSRDPASQERGKDLVKEFVAQVLEGQHDACRGTPRR